MVVPGNEKLVNSMSTGAKWHKKYDFLSKF
jgi:hypothetical protein